MTKARNPENDRDRKGLFLRACRGESVDRVPVWMMRQAGRYLPEYRALRSKHTFLETCKNAELAAEVSLQPFRLVGVDAVIVFSDILIPAEAMGMPLEIGDGGPVLAQPIRSRPDVEKLRDFDPERETRFLGDAIRMICADAGPAVPVLGFAAAPWTLACYMIEGRSKDGFPAAKRMMYSDPALLRTLLERIAANTAAYLRAQIAAGAAAVQLFDTWAGELSADDYRDVALPATQRVIEELRGAGAPIILYTKGSSHLLPLLVKTGADVLSVDWRIDLREARRIAGDRIALQGNVDPTALLGSGEQIRRKVENCVGQTGGVGHILNLGHGILPATPVENARLFVETARQISLPAQGATAGRA